MIKDRRICALIPARGGSKGIHRKNMYLLNGLSLVERSVRLAKKIPAIDKVIISTDDIEITELAKHLSVATPRPRPSYLATDEAHTIDVVRHLLEEEILDSQDCLLLLQPTTPLRTLVDLKDALTLFESSWSKADGVVSVTKIDGPHPYKAQVISDGYLSSMVGEDSAVPRQSLPIAYLPNGAIYFLKIDKLLDEGTFLPKKTIPYIMPAISSINLDGPLDLLLLEAIIEKGLAVQALIDSSA
jgi:CMP-N,N'-diacetyllegionaminic acid synthase